MRYILTKGNEMKIKTSELIDVALDWVVAVCDDRRIGFNHGGGLEVRGRTEDGEELSEMWDLWMPWHPSTNWAQGGPIIEREGVCVDIGSAGVWLAWSKQNYADEPTHMKSGPTALIAAMRCYVASKLGDEVDVPEELTTQGE